MPGPALHFLFAGSVYLWSTLSHPTASEAEWRRLPEEVRHHYRRQARQALGFDRRGFDAHGAQAYAAGA